MAQKFMVVEQKDDVCPKVSCNGTIKFDSSGMNEDFVEGRWFKCDICSVVLFEPKNGCRQCPTC